MEAASEYSEIAETSDLHKNTEGNSAGPAASSIELFLWMEGYTWGVGDKSSTVCGQSAMNDFDYLGRPAMDNLTKCFGVRGHASKQELPVKVTSSH